VDDPPPEKLAKQAFRRKSTFNSGLKHLYLGCWFASYGNKLSVQ